ELGGRLEVSTNYDTIDVTISGKASELERIVELVRNAIINLNLSADNVAKLRDARMAQITKTPASPTQNADKAVAVRLFGTFPYARPPAGDTESLTNVHRPHPMFAQPPFLPSYHPVI